MPANYSGLFGYGMNPYDPRPDPRAGTNDGRPVMGTGGSSSGIGTAAKLLGRQRRHRDLGLDPQPVERRTCWSASSRRSGLISRYGIIPITADQDTAGPMTRTVDRRGDPARRRWSASIRTTRRRTAACRRRATTTRATCGVAGLRGARIGIPRANFYRTTTRPDTGATVGGLDAPQLALMEEAIQILRNEGADDRRSRRHPEHTSTARPPTTSSPSADVRRPGQRQGPRRGVLDRVQVRHEARLQRLARVARPGRADQDADRAAPVQPGQPAAQRDQVRPGASRHLGRDGSGRRSRALARPIATRTSSSPRRTASTRSWRATTSTRCSSRAAAAPASRPRPDIRR